MMNNKHFHLYLHSACCSQDYLWVLYRNTGKKKKSFQQEETLCQAHMGGNPPASHIRANGVQPLTNPVSTDNTHLVVPL